jgi:hypothetical protein
VKNKVKKLEQKIKALMFESAMNPNIDNSEEIEKLLIELKKLETFVQNQRQTNLEKFKANIWKVLFVLFNSIWLILWFILKK